MSIFVSIFPLNFWYMYNIDWCELTDDLYKREHILCNWKDWFEQSLEFSLCSFLSSLSYSVFLFLPFWCMSSFSLHQWYQKSPIFLTFGFFFFFFPFVISLILSIFSFCILFLLLDCLNSWTNSSYNLLSWI